MTWAEEVVARAPIRGGPSRRLGLPAGTHAGRLRSRAAGGRRWRRVRRAAHPRRSSGLRARPQARSDVQRRRSGQHDDAGAACVSWSSVRGTTVGAPDGTHGDTGLLTLDALVSLVLDWNRPVKIFIETKHPVRYGSLVESKLLALLHRFGIASPASADRSRAVVMSFSAAAVWRIRRAAPLLPTVLLGKTPRYLASSAATTVGATAVGPSLPTLTRIPATRGPRRRPGPGACTAGSSTTTTTSTSAATSGWPGSPPTTRSHQSLAGPPAR